MEKIYSSDSDVLLAIKVKSYKLTIILIIINTNTCTFCIYFQKLNLSIKYLDNLSDVNLLEKNDILVTTLFEELAVKRPCFKYVVKDIFIYSVIFLLNNTINTVVNLKPYLLPKL